MKTFLMATVLLMAGTAAFEAPASTTKTTATAFLGLTWTFDSTRGAQTPGVTLKLLSTNKRNALAAAAGVTYNFDGAWGCDLGVGYNFNDATVTGSWDICRAAPQIGVGATKKPQTVADID